MSLLIWTLLTVGALLALFVVCVVAVVAGVRGLERVFGRRESGPAE
jgi:hypothetical protein